MRVTRALAALLLAASARAAVIEGPGPIEGLQIPALPATAIPSAPLSGALSTPLEACAPIDVPLPKAAALGAESSPVAQARSAAPRAATARASAQRASDGITAKAGAETAFAQVFDGNFKKGSIEADLVAPMPGRDGNVDLSRIDTAYDGRLTKKQAAKKLEKDREKLDVYGQKVWADKKHKILFVLQGMDTGGKDGIIKHVLKGMLPQVFKITGFKKPSEEEAKHDFLWRIKKALGGPGQISVFNRSHYEDALVPIAKGTLPKAEIDARIAQINDFERELTDQGWTVVKVFLHVSKEKNWERLEKRRTTKKKQWKLSPDDIVSRQNWEKNQDAYEYVIGRTNTPNAPWFIVPADKKWYRNYAVARLYKRALKRLHPKWPVPKDLPKRIPK